MMRFKTLFSPFLIRSVNNVSNCPNGDLFDKLKPSLNVTPVRGYRSAISRITRPDIRKYLYMDKLPCHILPNEILATTSGENIGTMELKNKLQRWTTNKLEMRSNEREYVESFRTMLHFEEAFEQIQLEKCNQEDVKLNHVDGNEFFFYVEPKMKDLCTFVNEFDQFDLKSKDGNVVSGEIVLKDDDKVYIELYAEATNWHEDQLYDIVFRFNRAVYLLQHQALDFVQTHNLFPLLINNPGYHSHTKNNQNVNNSEIMNKATKNEMLESNTLNESANLNEEQIVAVENIVAGRYCPLPYLLYGPPGTGKTKTIIAAIKNIVHTSNKKILVCAQSNAACDEITDRLSTFLDRNEMFHIYATSYDSDLISDSIKQFSNLFGSTYELNMIKFYF